MRAEDYRSPLTFGIGGTFMLDAAPDGSTARALEDATLRLPGFEAVAPGVSCMFDGSFASVATNGLVEVGIRTFGRRALAVVAPVGTMLEWTRDPYANLGTILDALGRPPEALLHDVDLLCDATAEHVRTTLAYGGSKVWRRGMFFGMSEMSPPTDPAGILARSERTVSSLSSEFASAAAPAPPGP